MNIGQSVVIRGVPSNGHDEQPGIITMAWDHAKAAGTEPGCGSVQVCNIKVFPDCGAPFDATSIKVFSSPAYAMNNCTDPVFGWVNE